MRIISGKYKSRLIKRPKLIRPTQDKVRKALFDILGDIEGLSFLELFAGSGIVGFEALSRGAKDLTLVEYNRQCLKLIKDNIESLGFTNCFLCPKEVSEAIKFLHREGKKFDIIFLDPPYYPLRSYSKQYLSGILKRYHRSKFKHEEAIAKKSLQTLSAYDILVRNGWVVIQHHKKEKLPHQLANFNLQRQERYGDTVLSFYNEKGI